LAIVVVIGALIFLIGGTWASVGESHVMVCRNGGMFDDKSVRAIVDPGGGRQFMGLATNCFEYPTSTRIYDASSAEDADRGPLTCTSRDAVAMRVAAAARFTLNTESHEQIRESFNEVLDRYDAHTDDGWLDMLHATIGRELDAQIESTCRRYTGREMASDEDVLAEVADSLSAGLRTRVNNNVGTDLFCGPGVPYGDVACPEITVSVTRMIADSDATRNAFELEVRAEAETRAAQQEVATAEARAEAVEALNEALANSGENFVLLELIRACQENPQVCPQLWVLDSNSGGITIPAPTPGG